MGRKLIKELSCVLTEEERNMRGAELAKAIDEHDALESEKKDFNANWKERKEELDKRIHRLADARNTGTELREIECREVPNWATKMVEVFRTDTGAKLFSRGMEAHELQSGMFDDDDESDDSSTRSH